VLDLNQQGNSRSMNLQMIAPATLANYKSRSQIARVVSEAWALQNLYCVACNAKRLGPTRNNNRGYDFECPTCTAHYQLKSCAREPKNRIVDSAYSAMRSAIESDQVPNLLILHYSDRWSVYNLLLIPSFCFSVTALEKRKPLMPTARRAGWIGCNILLNAIPPDAKIKVVENSRESSPAQIRSRFNTLRALTQLAPTVRGWTLDVLRVARSLKQKRFTLEQMYSFEPELSVLHPQNQNVRPKIRQQLQVLRDIGMLRFVSGGVYEFAI
jgi:type II restriction enzyme